MAETTPLIMRGFVFYTPEYNVHAENTPHLCDDQGRDWYYWQHKFTADSLKIVFDEQSENEIVSAGPDAHFLLPMGGPGYAITEVPWESVPEGFDISGDKVWFYQDGKIQLTMSGRALQMKRLRSLVLNATDFLVVADYPMSTDDKQAVTDARTALRDLTEVDGFPNVAFVELPDVMLGAARSKGMTLSEYNYLRTV